MGNNAKKIQIKEKFKAENFNFFSFLLYLLTFVFFALLMLRALLSCLKISFASCCSSFVHYWVEQCKKWRIDGWKYWFWEFEGINFPSISGFFSWLHGEYLMHQLLLSWILEFILRFLNGIIGVRKLLSIWTALLVIDFWIYFNFVGILKRFMNNWVKFSYYVKYFRYLILYSDFFGGVWSL